MRPPAEISQDCRRQIGYIPYRDGRKKVPVTVAAGFRCADGVLLCADSQITVRDYLKYQQEKVISVAGIPYSPCFVYCGDVYFSKDCIARLAASIGRSRNARLTANIRSMARTISKQQGRLGKGGAGILELLIALRRGQGIQLWHLWNTSLGPFPDFQVIGSGAPMMTASAQPLYSSAMTLREASYMAAYALYQTKEYGYGCGRNSLIYLAFDDGRRAVVTHDEIKELEASFTEFQKVSTAALTATEKGPLMKAAAGLWNVLGNAFAKRQSRSLRFL